MPLMVGPRTLGALRLQALPVLAPLLRARGVIGVARGAVEEARKEGAEFGGGGHGVPDMGGVPRRRS